MAKSSTKSKLRSVVFCLLSYLLSMCLFLLSVCTIISFTVFSKDYIYGNMNSSFYFIDKSDELKVGLTDLGYASGLDEAFFEGFIDDLLISKGTADYLDTYYSFESGNADTEDFESLFNEQLTSYAKEKNVTVNDDARKYLVKEAGKIYENTIEIPYFGSLLLYIKAGVQAMPFIIGGLVFLSAVIIFIFFKANRWKHKAIRYTCYATSGTFLAIVLIPSYLYFSQVMSKINVSSRAFYNFLQYTVANLELLFFMGAILFLLISIILFISHQIKRKKHTES